MKFTKEEISLCKQVAKKHRRTIKVGDWIKDAIYGRVFLVYRRVLKGFYFECINKKDGSITRSLVEIEFPLWTISDCLEFLQEREDVIELQITGKALRWFCRLGNHKFRSGKTLLEACLKAVLAVLKEVPSGPVDK